MIYRNRKLISNRPYVTRFLRGQTSETICQHEIAVEFVYSRTFHLKTILSDYRVLSHDVRAAILVSQNNETVAMLVSQTSPVGGELFSYANAFFCHNIFA